MEFNTMTRSDVVSSQRKKRVRPSSSNSVIKKQQLSSTTKLQESRQNRLNKLKDLQSNSQLEAELDEQIVVPPMNRTQNASMFKEVIQALPKDRQDISNLLIRIEA